MRTVKADRDYSKRNFTRDFGIEWRVAVQPNGEWVLVEVSAVSEGLNRYYEAKESVLSAKLLHVAL